MSFPKAAQNQRGDALYKFSLASMKHKEASTRFTIIRLACQHSDKDEDIVRYARAQKWYSQECREYTLARAEYIASVRAAAVETSAVSNDEILSLDIQTNQRALTKEIRNEAMARDPNNQRLMYIASKQTGRPVPDEFRNEMLDEEFHFTNGLYDASKDPDVSQTPAPESDALTFDPEFDKL